MNTQSSSLEPQIRQNIIDSTVQTPVLTLRQAASYLRVSVAHLSNIISGRVTGVAPIRHCRMGRRILFKREWLDQAVDLGATD